MCRNKKVSGRLSRSTWATVNLANNASIDIVRRGKIEFVADVDSRKKYVNLKKALYFPDLRTNLISENGLRIMIIESYSKKNMSSKEPFHFKAKSKLLNRRLVSYIKNVVYQMPVSISSLSKKKWRRFWHLNKRDLKQIIKLENDLRVRYAFVENSPESLFEDQQERQQNCWK